jgi:hypothetical protein
MECLEGNEGNEVNPVWFIELAKAHRTMAASTAAAGEERWRAGLSKRFTSGCGSK